MAHEDDARALRDELLDGGQRRADARVVGDGAVLHRHVEVDAHEHALAARVQLVDGFDLGHGALLSKRETSLPRQARFGECC